MLQRRQFAGKLRLVFYRMRRDPLLKALGAIVIVAFLAAAGVTVAEKYSDTPFSTFSNGLWWAIVTMTTVGYGDMTPITGIGRMVAVIVMLSGVALVSVFTAAISSRVITNRIKEGRGLSKVTSKNHIAILGWNSSGEDILQSITEAAIRDDRSVVLINQHRPEEIETIINKYQQLYIKFVFGDPTDEEVLKQANVQFAFSAIIIPDDADSQTQRPDERTILATLSVKSLNAKIKVVAHIKDECNEPHLRKANADHIVVDSRYSGYLLSAYVTEPGIPEAIDILLNKQNGARITRHQVPNPFVGKTFKELSLHLLDVEDLIVLGFVKESAAFTLNDILSDDYSSIDAFIKNKLEAAGMGLDKKSKLDVQLKPPKDYIISDKDIAIVLEQT